MRWILSLFVVAAIAGIALFVYLRPAAPDPFQDAATLLTNQEALLWGNLRMAQNGYQGDAALRAHPEYSTQLDPAYTWIEGPSATGGRLEWSDQRAELQRTPSSLDRSGRWIRVPAAP